MATGHFGLDDGPFHGKAEGDDVYLGAQQRTIVSRLRKALGTGDTVVAVSGPVGVGKTTLVRRAIADVTGRKILVPVDRIRLQPDEVLDLLLARFDVSREPRGTIQRVAAFRRLLQERLANDTRVFIVVEDAERVGVDALLEIEALTATDSGDQVGANIVLMGDTRLPELLAGPALARLRQRIRLRQAVAPFDADDVEGYMRHCLEVAGGVLEQIFEPGTARIVYRYSGGIARVVDTLCESALAAAAEAELATILPEFLEEVAESCGLEPQIPDADPVVGEPAGPVLPAVDEARDTTPAGSAPVRDDFEPSVVPAALPQLARVERPTVPVADTVPEDMVSEDMVAEDMVAEDAVAEDAVAEDVVSDDGRDAAAGRGPETGLHDSSPLPDPLADEECEVRAAVGAPAESASLAVSRIDDALPGLIERLQSSARGRGRPASAFAPPADDGDIPTLSSSMRIEVLPLGPMSERPSAADGAADDQAPPEGGECAADGARPDDRDTLASAAFEPPADEETGIAEAPVEKDRATAVNSMAVADEVAPAGVSVPERVAQEGTEAPEPDGAIAPAPADEAATVASPREERSEAAAPVEIAPLQAPVAQTGSGGPVATEIDSPPDNAGTGQWPAAAANEEPPAPGFASDESAPASNEPSPSPGAPVAETPDDEDTTEVAALSAEALAPEAAAGGLADRFVAGDADEPELDALQAAIRAADAWEASDAVDGDEDELAAAPPSGSGGDDDLPEISLDTRLEKEKPSRADIDRLAAEISKAKSLEDISDILAETIFGNEEVEAISAGIRADKAADRARAAMTTPPAPETAPSGPALAPAEAPARAASAGAPKPAPAPAAPGAARVHPAATAAPARPAPRPLRMPPAPPAAGGLSMTLSQRIEMVNSLNGKKHLKPIPGMPVAEIVLGEQPDEPAPRAGTGAPAPIEAQIDTAITQSLKAVSEADLARIAADPDDDGDSKGSRGLFGLFRRSSKR